MSALFPNARITSTYRSPQSALGRIAPNSWHSKSRAAVDLAPIPGLSFEDFVGRIKQSGYHVIEAIDEVRHPSKHATGPHWHVVIGKGA